jgi:hypothetical protein
MLWRLKFNKDRYGAALLILLGTAVVVAGNEYHMGSLTRMGPGFLPVVYGSLLILVGVLIGITSRGQAGHRLARAEWRGWFCILAGVLAFVVLGRWGGLLPATFASVFISAMGDRNNKVRDAALLALAMTVAGYLIFHVGLNLQLPPFQWG